MIIITTEDMQGNNVWRTILNAYVFLKNNHRVFFKELGDALIRFFITYQRRVGWWRTDFAVGMGVLLTIWVVGLVPAVHNALATGEITKGEFVSITLLILILIYLIMQNLIEYIDRVRTWVYETIFADKIAEWDLTKDEQTERAKARVEALFKSVRK